MVTCGGRLVYMLDDAPPGAIGIPGRWSLYARDAFNGTLLWKKTLGRWGWEAWSGSPTLQGKNGGRFTQPIHIPRTLAVDKERVFVTLSYGGPVTVLDARTGKLVGAVEEFHTYIDNNRDFVPKYGERYRHGQKISSATAASTSA